jgi:hypothetical protein
MRAAGNGRAHFLCPSANRDIEVLHVLVAVELRAKRDRGHIHSVSLQHGIHQSGVTRSGDVDAGQGSVRQLHNLC